MTRLGDLQSRIGIHVAAHPGCKEGHLHRDLPARPGDRPHIHDALAALIEQGYVDRHDDGELHPVLLYTATDTTTTAMENAITEQTGGPR